MEYKTKVMKMSNVISKNYSDMKEQVLAKFFLYIKPKVVIH